MNVHNVITLITTNRHDRHEHVAVCDRKFSRLGEIFTVSHSFAHTHTHTHTHIHTHTHTDAAGWKTSGNVFFSNKHYLEAVSSYTSGLSSLNQEPSIFVQLLLNMAAACLKTHKPREALAWSLAALRVCPSHVKAT